MRGLASPFFKARAYSIPFILLLRVALGTLVGFRRQAFLTGLNVGSAVLEVAFSYYALHSGYGLQGVGYACLFANLVLAVGGIAIIPWLAPAEAFGAVSLVSNNAFIAALPGANALRRARDLPLLGGAAATPMDYLGEGGDAMLRFLALQGTVLIATVCASRLGQEALVANHVALLVWMLTAAFIDGIANIAGLTVMNLLQMRSFNYLRTYCRYIIIGGALIGCLSCGVTYAFQAKLVRLLVNSAPSMSLLSLWSLLCIMQIVNAIVFTYDGLLVASAEFTFSRNSLVAGFVAVFLPALIIGYLMSPTLLRCHSTPLQASPCFPTPPSKSLVKSYPISLP